MPLAERDEYAERHNRRSFFGTLLTWLLWVLATGVGLIVGRTIGLVPDRLAQVSIVPYIGVLAARGAMVGLVTGALQGLVLLPLIRRKGYLPWLAASSVGWGVRAVLLFLISNSLVNAFSGFVPVDLALAGGAGGIVVGAALGIVQGYALRDHIWHQAVWVVASIGGACIGRVVAAFGITLGYADSLVSVTVVEGVVWAAVTGAVLAGQIRESRAASRVVATPELPSAKAVFQIGQPAEVLPGLLLAVEGVEVSTSSITWHAAARNSTSRPINIRLEPEQVKISDSTAKPYAVSRIYPSEAEIPVGRQLFLEIAASILSYSPIPPGVTYLELTYSSNQKGNCTFRYYLHEAGIALAPPESGHN